METRAICIRLPVDLIAALDLGASKGDRTRNRQVGRYIRAGLEADGLLPPTPERKP